MSSPSEPVNSARYVVARNINWTSRSLRLVLALKASPGPSLTAMVVYNAYSTQLIKIIVA